MFKVKIIIDTKEDSHEEIKKVIRMLSSLVGDEAAANQGNIFSDENKQATEGVFNIFGNSEGKTENEISNDSKKEESKEDIDRDFPELEEYR